MSHPLDFSAKQKTLDLSVTELPQAVHGDCAGTAGTWGTFGTAGGCWGSAGTFGTYGCGGGSADLGSLG